MTKVLLIGMDGVTLESVLSVAKRSELFREVFRKGAWGRLESTIPYITPVAWTSMATGNCPDRHGIFGFERLLGNKRVWVRSSFRRCEAIWNILSRYGRKSVVLNVPVTWPPETDPNVLICSGMFTRGKRFAFPPSLNRWLRRMGYVPGPFGIPTLNKAIVMNDRSLIAYLKRCARNRKEVALELMRRFDWDLFFVVFMATEIFQDRFFNQEERVEEFILWMDGMVEELYQAALQKHEDTILFVVSDHGHARSKRQVNLNKSIARILGNELKVNGLDLVYKLGKGIARNPPAILRLVYPLLSASAEILARRSLNSKATASYSYCFRGMFLNSRKREVEDLLLDKLSQLQDPETGEFVFKRVFRREDVYDGPYTAEAPSILFEQRPSFVVLDFGPEFDDTLFPIGHRKDGVFLAFGDGIRRRNLGASIVDITPTILRLLGIEPQGFDGKVLNHVLSNSTC